MARVPNEELERFKEQLDAAAEALDQFGSAASNATAGSATNAGGGPSLLGRLGAGGQGLRGANASARQLFGGAASGLGGSALRNLVRGGGFAGGALGGVVAAGVGALGAGVSRTVQAGGLGAGGGSFTNAFDELNALFRRGADRVFSGRDTFRAVESRVQGRVQELAFADPTLTRDEIRSVTGILARELAPRERSVTRAQSAAAERLRDPDIINATTGQGLENAGNFIGSALGLENGAGRLTTAIEELTNVMRGFVGG